MERLVDILILLGAISFVLGMGIAYGFLAPAFAAGTLWKFSIGCLAFAIALTLTQIRDK